MHSAQRIRRHLRVTGTVQGVGFRPAVHALACSLGLSGKVGNDSDGVFIEAEGPYEQVDALPDLLRRHAPPLAHIDTIHVRNVPPVQEREFVIMASRTDPTGSTAIPPDTAPCADCLAEMASPDDRRARYPFVNCTNCGPRFTIVRDLPYDRSTTTMAGFPLCAACTREYHDPRDRRFHAEPLCCPDCGPHLRLVDAERRNLVAGRRVPDDPDDIAVTDGTDGTNAAERPDAAIVAAAAQRLAAGEIVALKGVGGYQLLADAGNETAVARLRRTKQREEKPFALLVSDLDAARTLATVEPAEADLLTSPARPIVLLHRTTGASATGTVAPSVAPGTPTLGVMLPASPLHALVSQAVRRPLVCTSGNRADEPIAHTDSEAFTQLTGIADAFCTHDRPIHVRADDSVARVVAGRPLPLRRARGYAPVPVPLPWTLTRPLLAVGGELKSTVCVARDSRAVVSHHLGDLEHPAAMDAFHQAVDHYRRLFNVDPQVVAHDLHPQYRSSLWATEQADLHGLETHGVQHHHAHIASCLVDNAEAGPVLGVAFDGLGYGADGTLWGGELLVADLADAERVGHLVPVGQPGGDAAVRQPWRMALSYLAAAGPPYDDRAGPVARRRGPDEWRVVTEMARRGVHTPLTSSMGRLFDAMAAVAGIRDEIAYEGQAAIDLELVADPGEAGAYPCRAEGAGTVTDPLRIPGVAWVTAASDDVADGVPTSIVAARFHNGLAATVLDCCLRLRENTGLNTVALSGGVFQNALLVERLVAALNSAGFRALTHRQVPPNDGGLSLGQLAVVGARERRVAQAAATTSTSAL